ncbi:MAG: WecB/TagA/CpsF family glycosyltransferase [Candidatus Zipacnadales bacterium]
MAAEASGGSRPARNRFDGRAVALLASVVLVALLASVMDRPEAKQLSVLGASALWIALWGLITDRWVVPRGLRALALLMAAVILHQTGLQIDVIKLPFSSTFVQVGIWSLPVVALWMWLCSTLFARAGTIPRVAYGVGMIACATLIIVCLEAKTPARWPVVSISGAIGAVCLATFLGDRRGRTASDTAGAYLLGFFIGAVSIMGMLKNTAFLAAVLPLLLISVPLFGATYTYVADLRHGVRRMALTQRHEHLHQLLLREGYSPLQISWLLTLGAGWCGLLAVLLVYLIEVHFTLKGLLLVVWMGGGFFGGYVLLRILPRQPDVCPKAIRLFGVRITPLSMDEVRSVVREYIRQGSPHLIVTSDATGVVRAQEDSELRRIMEQADLVTADGQGVVLAARLLNVPIRERVSGVDMVQHLCEVAAEEGRSVFLLGGVEGVAEEAAHVLCSRVPGLVVAGTHHGYFAPEEEPEIIARIREAQPAVLFVAFGIPKQEKWIHAHMEELGVPVCIGVGGSFDVISGRLRRAPLWMQRWGLEWLFRVCQEPRRLPRLKALPQMAWLALRALLRGERGYVLHNGGHPPR